MGNYENGATARRNSNWQLIGYEESLSLVWRDIIERETANWYISPLHDRDVFTKDEQHKNVDGVIVEHKAGEKKKPHYHILVKFDSLKSWEQVKEWAQGFGCATIQSVMSWTGSLRYLCHLDGGTGKELYNVRDVKCCNDDYLTVINQSSDRAKLTREVLAWVRDTRCKDFHKLVNKALDTGSDWINEVRQYAFFYRSICQSIRCVNQNYILTKEKLQREVNSANEDTVPF